MLFGRYLGYPKLIFDNLVYTGFCDARQLIPAPTTPAPGTVDPDQHNEKLVVREPAAAGETRKEGLQGPGKPVVSVAQAFTWHDQNNFPQENRIFP